MPKAWSSKDERMYEHVKESELDRGHPTAKAKEIAARTVNKQRSKEGPDRHHAASLGWRARSFNRTA